MTAEGGINAPKGSVGIWRASLNTMLPQAGVVMTKGANHLAVRSPYQLERVKRKKLMCLNSVSSIKKPFQGITSSRSTRYAVLPGSSSL